MAIKTADTKGHQGVKIFGLATEHCHQTGHSSCALTNSTTLQAILEHTSQILHAVT